MPIAYLDVPEGIEIEAKKELVKRIFEVLHEAYPFPLDHRIFVREWPLDVEAKRKMIKGINAAVAKAYNNLSKFLILLQEYPQERVAINGNLNADDQKHLEELGRSFEASLSSKAVYRQ